MRTIALVGLGYVGLGLALELAKKNAVIGYDISKNRIEELKNHNDVNSLCTVSELSESSVHFTDILDNIRSANFYIVTVSTPAYFYELPDLEPLIKATKDLSKVIKKGDIVVYESTVYPGTTEEVCLPLLEEGSKLKHGIDFFLAYSPERINPGDTMHTLRNTTKVIAACNEQTLSEVKVIYESCCDKVYVVSSIKTAEAVKILENTQRDINIAILNEFAEIMHALDLNVHEILEAAKTKWSFMPFKPGFVGGHCISVDPLYLAFKAKRLGVDHDLILAARKVNDNMTRFVLLELIKLMFKHNVSADNLTVGIFGITYKENVPDVRNSLALKLVKELKNAGFKCLVHDPIANKKSVEKRYHVELHDFDEIREVSAALVLVPHDFYKEVGIQEIAKKINGKKIMMDLPNIFIDDHDKTAQLIYWSL